MSSAKKLETVYYECPSSLYVQKGFVRNEEEAVLLSRVLCGYARERAARNGIHKRIAYKEIVLQFCNVLEPEAGPVPFGILVLLERSGKTLPTADDASGFMSYVRKTFEGAWDTMALSIRTELFQKRFWCLRALVFDHVDCKPERPDSSDSAAMDVLLRGIELWAEINCLVPPCKYLRLQQTLADKNIVPDAARAVLQKHGADVLDDLVEGLRNDSLDESAMWGMSVLDELPHDPSFQRQPVPPVLGENVVGNAIEHAFPEWKAREDFTVPRGGLFEDNHEYRPGWYRPTEMPKNETGAPGEPSAEREGAAKAETSVETAMDAAATNGSPEKFDAFYDGISRVCASCGGDRLRDIWGPMRSKTEMFPEGRRIVGEAETAIVRMFARECTSDSTGQHKPGTSLDDVLHRITSYKEKLDEAGVPILGLLERCGIQYSDSRELEAVRKGLRQRFPDAKPLAHLLLCRDLLSRMREDASSLTGSQRSALTHSATLLNGIDLFAVGEGSVPLATCLRTAVAAVRKNVGWVDIYYLWRIHLPGRAEELLARLENPKTGIHDILRMLQRH